ncbi:hypothetical protein ACJIZ3_010466 [Penstemon smallii]|uniref:Uncharacterized protein n=1 Tax=Penstemon smallii TaxID=265156 RepID=A0ABD3TFD7_9LAMI
MSLSKNIYIIAFLFFLILLANSLIIYPYFVLAEPPRPTSRITILGSVYCDVCHHNTFSKHSYFLPGVDVHVECKFKANSPRTTEQISFSVNRSTNIYGAYKLEIPDIDGVDCAEDRAIESFCQASLIGSSVSRCNVPCTRSSSTEITVKSKENNLCTYTLGALSYKPKKRNVTLCRNQSMELGNSWNSSKFFLPYLPPYNVFPQLPPLPQFPHLPPLPSFPLPPPYTNMNPPISLPFPFPPPFPQAPPPPPVFNFWDPRTWFPYYPPTNPNSHHP